MTPEQRDKKLEVIKNQVQFLLEHFDAVQVFACSYEKGEKVTAQYAWGGGIWHARYGLAREWIAANENNMKIVDEDKDSHA